MLGVSTRGESGLTRPSAGTLLISTFPPEQCGVAAYAAQQVDALRAQGVPVKVLTWGEGRGDLVLPTAPTGLGALAMVPHARQAERVILHYMPSFYERPHSRIEQVLTRVAMGRLFRLLPHLQVIVHEQSWYPPFSEMSVPGRLLWWLERRQWMAARDLCFHNEAAIDLHRRRFRLPGDNARLIRHGEAFRPYFDGDRDAARRELGLAAERLIFLSVGFITPYKGYETVIGALANLPDFDCEYHIVGTLHPKSGQADADYLESLVRQASSDVRVRFVREFIDDRAFDRWIRAADAVLLPYRSSTSSSVLARCRLLGTRAIVSSAAGLAAELGPRDTVAQDAAWSELLAAFPRDGA